jgi:hypothetical protein
VKVIWIKLCDDTTAMEVPGGILVKHQVEQYDGEQGRGPVICMSEALAFVPGARLDCSKMEETGVAELISSTNLW